MSQLPAVEARALLDAMGIPVVKLRSSAPEPSARQPVVTPVHPDEVAEPKTVVLPPALQADVPPEAQQTEVTETARPERPSQPLPQMDETEIADLGSGQDAPESLCPPFSVISARSRHVLLVAELPEWSDGLLDGRLGALLGDILQSIGCERETVDWQYFRWPLAGLPDQSMGAAHDALDAWIHRRWGEIEGGDPLMLVHLRQCDSQTLAPDAVLLPALDALLVTPALKRSLWQTLKPHARSS